MGEAGQPPQPVHLGPVRHGRVAEVELLQLRHLRPRPVQPRHRALGQRHRVQAADSNMKFRGQTFTKAAWKMEKGLGLIIGF